MTPTTPTKRLNDELNSLLKLLVEKWGIDLPIVEGPISPAKVQVKSQSAAECFQRIKYLFYRARESLTKAIASFEKGAGAARTGLKPKPSQDPGTLPGRAKSEDLTLLLLQFLDQEYQVARSKQGYTAAPASEPAKAQTLDMGAATISLSSSKKKTYKQQQLLFAHNISLASQGQGNKTQRPEVGINKPAAPNFVSTEDLFWRGDSKGRPSSESIHDVGEGHFLLPEETVFKGENRERDATMEGNIPRKRPHEISAERVPHLKLPRSGDNQPLNSSKVRTRLPAGNIDHDTQALDKSFDAVALRKLLDSSTNPTSATTSFNSKDSTRTSFTNLSTGVNTSFSSVEPPDRRSFKGLSSKVGYENGVISASTSFNRLDQPPTQIAGRFSFSGSLQPILGQDEMEIDNARTQPSPNSSAEREGDMHFTQAFQPGRQPVSSQNLSPDKSLRERLHKDSPFKTPPARLSELHLRFRYELSRISLATGVELSELVENRYDMSCDYETFWSQIRRNRSLHGKSLPDKSDAAAWDQAEKSFCKVSMTGVLEFTGLRDGPVFRLKLMPLKIEDSYRLGRRFGFDRFLKLVVPELRWKELKHLSTPDLEAGLDAIIDWLTGAEHQIVGRKWSAFWQKDHPKPSKSDLEKGRDSNLPRRDVFLFATGGGDFVSGDKLVSNKDEPITARTPMSVEAMLDWFIPFKENLEQPYLKIFSRISLGFTKTTATCALKPSQIDWRKTDIISPDDSKKVMNDGCDVISPSLAHMIVESLNIQGPVPSAFQARIAGAKGMWIVDPCKSHYAEDRNQDGSSWISITPSQVKFQSHPIDKLCPADANREDRMTFEVVKYSKPLRPTVLNFNLIVILEARGVPRKVFEDLSIEYLSSELADQRAAITDMCLFRKWIHDNSSMLHDEGQDTWAAGLPISISDRIILLLEGGFSVQDCRFLKELTWKAFGRKFDHLRNRLNIPLGRSTSAFCVPDVTRTLEEGTVHLAFSGLFVDQRSKFQDTVLNDVDILVARSPTNRACDIQKVRAVVNPKLSRLKDVIVFSTRGKVPLAEKLAGGDYDGDRVWICWDPAVVGPFQNAPLPVEPKPEELGIVIERMKMSQLPSASAVPEMISRSFSFGAKANMLGVCTKFYKNLCYTEGSITSKGARWIAALLGYLVDRVKQGYMFSEASWNHLQDRKDLVPIKPKVPAYENSGVTRPTNHIIDHLKLTVAPSEVDKTLAEFNELLKDVPFIDDDLSGLWKRAKTSANTDPQLGDLLKGLEGQIREVRSFWNSEMQRNKTDETHSRFKAILENSFCRFEAILPPASEHPLISWWAKEGQASDWKDKTSEWKLLKASAVFYLFGRNNFPWHMAGPQLVHLKLKATNRLRPVDERIHASYKPDSTFFRRKREKMALEGQDAELSEEDEFDQLDAFDVEELC